MTSDAADLLAEIEALEADQPDQTVRALLVIARLLLQMRAAREDAPLAAEGHVRPVGCPVDLYEGLTPAQGLQVTRAFLAGLATPP